MTVFTIPLPGGSSQPVQPPAMPVVPVEPMPGRPSPFEAVLSSMAGRASLRANFLGNAVVPRSDQGDAAAGGEQTEADIFNQDGLFQGAVAPDAITPPPAALPTPVSYAAPTSDTDLVPLMVSADTGPDVESPVHEAVILPPSSSATGSSQAGATVPTTAPFVASLTAMSPADAGSCVAVSAGSARSAAPIASAAPARELHVSRPAGPPVSAALFADSAEDTEERSSAHTRRTAPRDVPDRGTESDILVSVGSAEQGIRVAATLDAVGRDGRLRLRDRIAALLSRHGHGVADIRVNGVSLLQPLNPNDEA